MKPTKVDTNFERKKKKKKSPHTNQARPLVVTLRKPSRLRPSPGPVGGRATWRPAGCRLRKHKEYEAQRDGQRFSENLNTRAAGARRPGAYSRSGAPGREVPWDTEGLPSTRLGLSK